jgi:uncharacterized YccA/Bax inhibitor family protein
MNGKKTYITAALAIGYAVFAYLTHHVDLSGAAQLVETAVLGAFIRHGVSTAA